MLGHRAILFHGVNGHFELAYRASKIVAMRNDFAVPEDSRDHLIVGGAIPAAANVLTVTLKWLYKLSRSSKSAVS